MNELEWANRQMELPTCSFHHCNIEQISALLTLKFMFSYINRSGFLCFRNPAAFFLFLCIGRLVYETMPLDNFFMCLHILSAKL